VVLRAFVPERINKVRDAYLAAEAAIKLRAMFVLEDELSAAAELFAQKFADILRRHRIVFGKDVFASLAIPRGAEIFRLRQVLMNLVLRLRESYVGRGHRPEQVRAILERLLARMLTDGALLERLLADPAKVARQEGLSSAEADAVARMPAPGLRATARGFQHERDASTQRGVRKRLGDRIRAALRLSPRG
jgi:hypothetical protein